MNRLDRLFALTLLLQRKKRVRAQDLARTFEVSERTIYRDIGALSESGVPIVSLPGEGYELAAGFFLPPLFFTSAEAQALFLGLQILATHTTGQWPRQAENALVKIVTILPSATRAEVERLADAVYFALPEARFDLDDPRLVLVQQALREHRLLRLRYHSYSRNEITDREIEPYKLAYSEGHWYLYAYCRLRQEFRSFRFQRFEALTLLNIHFKPRPLPESTPALDQLVRVRFAPDGLRWVRERQHYSFYAEAPPAPDGSIVMTYQVNAISELFAWLLGWGANAEVLAPPELRAALRAEAVKLAEKLK